MSHHIPCLPQKAMSDKEFRKSVESGEVSVDCHDQLIRMAYVYMEIDGGLMDCNGIFDVINRLNTRG